MDTSALLKKYFKESGSNDVISGWKDAYGIVTSSVAYAETVAAIHRKMREIGGKMKGLAKVLETFKKDWISFIRVEVNDNLNRTIDRIVADHPLRGFDAIHLASALITHENIPEAFYFACFDQKLLAAARKEGLQALPGTAID
jgi:predicted nucleic acid-binding protein